LFPELQLHPELINHLPPMRLFRFIHQAVVSRNLDNVRRLIQLGAHVELLTASNRSAIHVAMQTSCADIAHFLRQQLDAVIAGADPARKAAATKVAESLVVRPAPLLGHYGGCDFGVSGDLTIAAIKKTVLKDKTAAQSAYVREDPQAETVAFVRGLRPVHRMSVTVFEKVLTSGTLMTRAQLQRLADASLAVRLQELVESHQNLANLLQQDQLRPHMRNGYAFVLKFAVLLCFDEAAGDAQKRRELADFKIVDVEGREVAGEVQRLRNEVGDLEGALQGAIMAVRRSPGTAPLVMTQLKDIARAVLKSAATLEAGKGLNWQSDEFVRTTDTVFAVLGPNDGKYGDVAIVLHQVGRGGGLLMRQDVMRHPDAYVVPNAATSYVSGWASLRRPWVAYATKDPSFCPPCTHPQFEVLKPQCSAHPPPLEPRSAEGRLRQRVVAAGAGAFSAREAERRLHPQLGGGAGARA
jgi:hypothetical protein